MRRLPLTLRALVLLPLLAVLTDQTRAAVMCGPRAESCLEAAGQGWSAALGFVALALYGIGLALLVARLAGSAPGLGRLWALGTGAIWASCGAQAGVASLLGAGSALGGGWLGLLALGVLAGAVLALALRVGAEARAGPAARRTAPPLLRRGRLATARALVDGHERRPAAPDARPRAAGRSPSATAAPPPAARHPCASANAHPLRTPEGVPCPAPPSPSASCASSAAPSARPPRRPRPRAPAGAAAWQLGAAAGARRRAVVVAVAVSSSAGTQDRRHARKSTLFTGIPEHDGVLGDPKAPVTVTEFLDLQCPICAEASKPTLPRSSNDYVRTGKVKLEARTLHFIGPDSVRAARVGRRRPAAGPPVAVRGGVLRRPGPGELGLRDRRLPALGREAPPASTPATALASRGRPPRAAAPCERADAEATRLSVNSTPTFAVDQGGGSTTVIGSGVLDAATLKAALDKDARAMSLRRGARPPSASLGPRRSPPT